jgi:putative pre-16S rRNA nuclease
MTETVHPLLQLKNELRPGACLLGLDLGTETIGIAVSNSNLTIASPLQTIARTKFTADGRALLDLVSAYNAGGLVLGLPLNMDGSEGPRAQSTRAFARNLQQIDAPPLIFWDERLSTVAVTRTLLEADVSREKRRKAVDKMAAAFILQGALDYLHHIPCED